MKRTESLALLMRRFVNKIVLNPRIKMKEHCNNNNNNSKNQIIMTVVVTLGVCHLI